MDTFRLNFIDIDQSFNIPVADTAVSGFMVVRAPKGTAEPMYFPRGQATQIHSMLGVPSAHWQDLQDAIDFNNQFGLWISAPAGSDAEYPTTYGGMYITSRGIFPFFEVTNKTEPNYRALVRVAREKDRFLHQPGSDSVVDAVLGVVDGDYHVGQDESIMISNIHPQLRAAADGLRIRYWGNPNFAAQPGEAVYQLSFRGTKVVTKDPSGAEVEVGTFEGGVLTLAGTAGDNTFLTINFDNLVDASPYLTDDGDFKLVQEDAEYNENTYKEAVTAALIERLEWTVNIEDDTYAVIAQKSPTEHATRVTITDVGFDKYLYDLSLNMYRNEMVLEGRGVPYPSVEDTGHPNGLYFVMNEDSAYGTTGIYQSRGDSLPPENVTDKYRTRYIRIRGAGLLRDTEGQIVLDEGVNPEEAQSAEFIDTLQFITATGQTVQAEVDGAVKPRLNPRYNTITFRLEEEVYPGQLTAGGTFHGSLDEAGRDSFGAKIFFPEVLPDNALSFAEIDVVRKFDSDVADSGFYTGHRFIDPHSSAPNTLTTEIVGTRFINKVNHDLRAQGVPGGAAVPEYERILREGWQAAASNKFDPVRVFMEPTGIESLKEDLYALRQQSHKMSTFISGRKMSAAEKNDVSSIVVVGRSTGTAQYVNEFLRRDPYTGKKYWTNLIGAVGTKLCAIIQSKMGGWAPMFTDAAGLGGQLAINVEKARYEFNAEEQRILDEKGLNPIILDSSYGLMIISQKTTQDPDNLSDWSYLGHSMAFDLFKREIRDNVMMPQIGKPNDPYYQNMRQQQADAILARRIGGGAPIWAGGRIEVANVNTDEIKAQRKFKIKATVKVNVFSEFVELEFVNISQMVQL